VTVFKVEIVEPADNRRFDITYTPTMPAITSTARIVGTTVEPNYSWELSLSYPRYSLCSDLLLSGTGINWTPNFGSTIMGGDYQLKTNATISNIFAKDDTSGIIRGLNPSRQNVREAIGNDQTALSIGCLESSLNGQFTDNGNPNEGRTRDFGIFQITVGTGATCADIWNWRENVRHGLRILQDKRRDAANHHIGERSRINDVRSALPQPLPACPIGTPPALSASEQEREAIRRYNGGREYQWTITNDQTCAGYWRIDPVCPIDNIGYVNAVLNSNCP
jgi:hypothetical protein